MHQFKRLQSRVIVTKMGLAGNYLGWVLNPSGVAELDSLGNPQGPDSPETEDRADRQAMAGRSREPYLRTSGTGGVEGGHHT
jgi:hypothetical protein